MTEQMDATTKRERSPEYPAFDLEEALNKARVLYKAEKRNAAPIAATFKHWDYSPRSGAGQRAVATLDKFGLVTTEGSGDNRKIKLSEEAFKILVDERPDSPDRLQLIREAALLPAIHSDLWKMYGADLPSEDTLRFGLRTRGFSELAANELMREYRRTLAFAKLERNATLTEDNQDNKLDPDESNGDGQNEHRRREQGMTVLSLQVSDRLVEIAVAGGPLTKSELAILCKYLELQKLVAPGETVELAESKLANDA